MYFTDYVYKINLSPPPPVTYCRCFYPMPLGFNYNLCPISGDAHFKAENYFPNVGTWTSLGRKIIVCRNVFAPHMYNSTNYIICTYYIICIIHSKTYPNIECTVGWVNFSELEITVCGSCKISKKNSTDHFNFFFFFCLRKSLIIFPPAYIVQKNYIFANVWKLF